MADFLLHLCSHMALMLVEDETFIVRGIFFLLFFFCFLFLTSEFHLFPHPAETLLPPSSIRCIKQSQNCAQKFCKDWDEMEWNARMTHCLMNKALSVLLMPFLNLCNMYRIPVITGIPTTATLGAKWWWWWWGSAWINLDSDKLLPASWSDS